MRDAGRRESSDVMVGALAALRAPRTIDTSLKSLLDAPPSADGEPRDCARSIRVAHRTLRLLSMLPGGRWRNTCLFRSVAECTVRRARGWPAHVAIGVGSADAGVIAHSWVEIDGVAAIPEASATLFPLRSARANDIADRRAR